MKVGFIGLGKLSLPCALAVESRGHEVYAHDIDPNIATILATRRLPYREEGAPELLAHHRIRLGSVADVVSQAEIIFVAIQTPHDYKYEGCTRIPEERDDFSYAWLTAGISTLSAEIAVQRKDKVVIIVSTVLPGTIEREIRPIIH